MKIGEKFGKLTIVGIGDDYVLPCGQKNKSFICDCECGKQKRIRALHLKRGKIKSCGCIVLTRNGCGNMRIVKVWRGMILRCKENYSERHLYFDKGITVCKEWSETHKHFTKWAYENGYKKGLQIDRRDNSKGYSPENCRWVTSKVNCNNRDCTFYINYKDEKIALKMLLERLNRDSDYYTILGRIKRGMDHNTAIDKPIRTGNYKRNGRS